MRKQSLLLLLSISLLMTGCAGKENTVSVQRETGNGIQPGDSATDNQLGDFATDSQSESAATEEQPKSPSTETGREAEPRILHFVDAFGESYETEIREDFPFHSYDMDAFRWQEERVNYETEDCVCRQGIDVSAYQGNVDWEKVRASGCEFAFIRLGFRGYGQAGNICLDKKYQQNMQRAQAAGVDVGVYFFSQAINEEEAIEEAQFVLKQLEGYDLQLPVVYDPESIIGDDSRTDGVSGEQFTKNSLAFCREIQDAGYDVMIYSNMKWEAFELDLAQLAEYPIWYADYEPLPQTPYDFTVWQYSESGKVDGIDGVVDLDLWIERK